MNMKKSLSILFAGMLLLASVGTLDAQKRYWVFFRDKDGVKFDPYAYFDPAAIQKRNAHHIPLAQYTDLPLREDYLQSVRAVAGETGTQSRWFNAVAVSADANTLEKISALSFVSSVAPVQMVASEAEKGFKPEINDDLDQLREAQVNEFGVINFEEKGIDGTGVRIAIFDGGFPGVDKSPMFEHIRASGRIIATWDFVKKKEYVYDYSTHGTNVLTCIAGVLDGKKFGLAPGAEFLLARTEVTREVFSEEENWLAAVEWADKNGADIISSSLGYTFKRYFPHDMDGKSTLVTRAANLAAAKGLLVLNAAGNDGDKDWEVIGAPADADSILSIGGISPDNGYHIKFSSYGPTFDGRMKPNLCSFGKVAASGPSKVRMAFGTSFATPLVSGFAACVKQMHPEWDNMKMFDELQKSGHLWPYFDYAHGYGVPQAEYFTSGRPAAVKSFSIERSEDGLKITDLQPPYSDEDTVIVEETEARYFDLDENILYYKIIPEGETRIRKYALVEMYQGAELNLSAEELESGDRIEIHYRGSYESYLYSR